MALEYGLSANRETPNDVRTGGISQLSNFFSKLKNGTQVGKVRDIILNEQYPNIERYGGDSAIGSIFFTLNGYKSGGRNVAKPLFPQSNYYPLKHELVLILELPDASIGSNDSQNSFYYLNVINIWNAPNHNAYPDTYKTPNPSKVNSYEVSNTLKQPIINSQKPPYNDNVDEFYSDFNKSQNTFIERENIHPLQPFSGDSIYQGRWGNSIRFSSTTLPKTSDPLNNWSKEGKNGDPITLIRNGQPRNIKSPGWKPIIENINKDLSSIYLTSTQKLPIIASSDNYSSYNSSDELAPQSPNTYSGNQVVINSGRLFFQSDKDHIMLSAKKTINFNSSLGFYFDTPQNFVVNAGNTVKLGGQSASESLVLGDTLKTDLDFIISVLIQLVGVIEFSILYPGGLPVPDTSLSVVASNCKDALQTVKDNLNQILSIKCKTL